MTQEMPILTGRLPFSIQRAAQSSVLALAMSVLACSGADGDSTPSAVGGATSAGGASGNGGARATGGATVVQSGFGGAQSSTGGATVTAQTGGAASGGQSASGGIAATGGMKATGGNIATGGSLAGGATSTGGTRPTGGTTSTGGKSAGGAAIGGAAAGGAVTGGAATTGGSSASGAANGGAANGGAATGGTSAMGGGTSCPFPTSFKWTSSGPLAKVPRTISGHSVIAIKDFTNVVSNGKHIVYATAYEGGWKSAMFTFTDWADWDATPGIWVSKNAVAPTLVYFTPKKIWVLTYQWGFQYATTDDPTDPTKLSASKSLLTGGPSSAIDQTLICDSTNCYLFFAGDNGNIYRSTMPIGSFPGTFSGYQTIMTDTQANLFEAVQVYAVQGTGKYLMIVEAMGGGGRYFRAFSSTSLGGTFTAIAGASTEATPFAGKKNVTFTGTAWTNDISHGDMVRSDPSETQTIDPCNMQFLYQGYDKTVTSSDYGTIPYQPGLLTLIK